MTWMNPAIDASADLPESDVSWPYVVQPLVSPTWSYGLLSISLSASPPAISRQISTRARMQPLSRHRSAFALFVHSLVLVATPVHTSSPPSSRLPTPKLVLPIEGNCTGVILLARPSNNERYLACLIALRYAVIPGRAQSNRTRIASACNQSSLYPPYITAIPGPSFLFSPASHRHWELLPYGITALLRPKSTPKRTPTTSCLRFWYMNTFSYLPLRSFLRACHSRILGDRIATASIWFWFGNY